MICSFQLEVYVTAFYLYPGFGSGKLAMFLLTLDLDN